MKLIVGFGNPETKYNFTRHNFGFLALDFYAKVKNLTWEKSPKFNAVWFKASASSLGLSGNQQIVFIKPQTYYNNVGAAVQAFAHFYKINPVDILVVCDDFNLDFGQIRYRMSGSAGGNNGLKSTIAELSTPDFPRLRLGTSNATRAKIADTDFVLGKFSAAEKESLPSILRASCAKIDEFITS